VKKYQTSPSQKHLDDLKTSILDIGASFKESAYFSKSNSTGGKEILLAKIMALYAILKVNKST
jgi:hypothetical protein